MNYETIIRYELALRHQLRPGEGFDALALNLLAWLKQYQGIEAHIAWDDMLPSTAVVSCLRNTPTLGMNATIQALTQLDFNWYVIFLRNEASEAITQWAPLAIALQAFDPLEQAWSFRGDKPVISAEALQQYLLG